MLRQIEPDKFLNFVKVVEITAQTNKRFPPLNLFPAKMRVSSRSLIFVKDLYETSITFYFGFIYYDGSLLIYAARENIPCINLEADGAAGIFRQRQMLEAIYALLPKTGIETNLNTAIK